MRGLGGSDDYLYRRLFRGLVRLRLFQTGRTVGVGADDYMVAWFPRATFGADGVADTALCDHITVSFLAALV